MKRVLNKEKDDVMKLIQKKNVQLMVRKSVSIRKRCKKCEQINPIAFELSETRRKPRKNNNWQHKCHQDKEERVEKRSNKATQSDNSGDLNTHTNTNIPVLWFQERVGQGGRPGPVGSRAEAQSGPGQW